MKKTYLFIVVTLFIFFISCSSSGSDMFSLKESISNMDASTEYSADYDKSEKVYLEEEYEDSESDDVVSTNANDIAEIKMPDKIIKTANISIEIENYPESIKQIKNTIDKWKGFISNENENSYSYMASNILTIRVGNEHFANLIDDLTANVKKVETKSVSATDVSEEFVDIQTRLKTKKEVEKRYIELLKQAYTVKDILYVEEQIRVIREEIEAKEGRLKYLKDRVAFSTITIEIKEYYKDDIYEPGFGEDMGDAFGGGWEGFLVLLIGITYLWPLWLIIAVTFFILFKFVFKKKKK